MTGLVLEKDPKPAFMSEQMKKYEFEKELSKTSTHIYLKKETEFATVQRIINRYENLSGMEFDTIFKLYKFQNYSLTYEYFKGSIYSKGSLSSYLSMIRHITKNSKSKFAASKLTSYQVVRDFLKDVMKVSVPFNYIFNSNLPRKKVIDLVNSNTLSKDELVFIESAIKPRRANSSARHKKSDSSVQSLNKGEITQMKKENTTKFRRKLTDSDYETIINNYQLGKKVVSSLLPKVNEKTVGKYISYCLGLDRSRPMPIGCPKLFAQAWSSIKDATAPLNVNPNSIKLTLPTVATDNYVIMDGNNNFLKFADSKEFALGFIAGYTNTSNNEVKLYKLTEVKVY